MTTQATVCPTCRQNVPGPFEPTGVGAVVVCDCLASYVKLRSTGDASRWRDVSRERSASKWLRILAEHRGPGHQLRVVHPGRPEDGTTL